jgi:DNA repair protein RecO (recombination protein O)
MPLLESEAIVLRSTALGDADKLVSLFTRRFGRLQGVAPYARRSRRRFGSTLEPLSYVRAWFFERQPRNLVRLVQTELLASFWHVAGDYERTVALSHVAELLELLLPDREPAERSFRLTLLTLRALQQAAPLGVTLVYFQLWSVRLAGFLPDFASCCRCRRQIPSQEPGYLDSRRGGIFCRRCALPAAQALQPRDRAILEEMQAHSLSHLLSNHNLVSTSPPAALESFLLDLIESHLERKLTTRELLHAKA